MVVHCTNASFIVRNMGTLSSPLDGVDRFQSTQCTFVRVLRDSFHRSGGTLESGATVAIRMCSHVPYASMVDDILVHLQVLGMG